MILALGCHQKEHSGKPPSCVCASRPPFMTDNLLQDEVAKAYLVRQHYPWTYSYQWLEVSVIGSLVRSTLSKASWWHLSQHSENCPQELCIQVPRRKAVCAPWKGLYKHLSVYYKHRHFNQAIFTHCYKEAVCWVGYLSHYSKKERKEKPFLCVQVHNNAPSHSVTLCLCMFVS